MMDDSETSAAAPVMGVDNVLEADDRFYDNDVDSALGDEMSWASSTSSLRSSIMRLREENGRQYHAYKDGKYVLPIDEQELERQEFQYWLCQHTFDFTLSFAPLNNVHRVLDVGCGLGMWTIDFADKHPGAEVLGVDLSPVQPPYVPSNVQFEIDDLEEPWTFSFTFDYIHALMMTGAFRDWQNFYRQAFDNLNSGGYVEVQDIAFPLRSDDGSLTTDSVLNRWSSLMVEAGEKSGFSLTDCGRSADMMRDAGFVDIVCIPYYKWPINPWPRDPKYKQIGAMVHENFTMGVETMMLALFTRFMGWSKEDVVAFGAQVKDDWKDVKQHAYFNLYVTFGRKP